MQVIKKKDEVLATKIYKKTTPTLLSVIITLLTRASKLITKSKDFKEKRECCDML